MKLEDIMDSMNATEIKTFAAEKTDALAKDLKKAVKSIKKMDVKVSEHPLLGTLMDNMTSILNRVQGSQVVEMAKDSVSSTKNQVLSVLNVPSQVEMDNLTRKMASLEKKIKTLNKPKGRSK